MTTNQNFEHVAIGRRALRNIAFVKDPENLLHSGELLYGGGVNSGGNLQLAMLKAVHQLPTESPQMLTGMVTFNPNITVFEPGDEDVGRFANAYDQVITSRSADVTFSTDGSNFEDLAEMGEAIAKALTKENGMPLEATDFTPELNAGTLGFPTKAMSKRTYIRPDVGVPINSGQEFQLYRLMWEEGLDRMYVMPGTVLNSIQLNATLRQAVRMSAQFTGADVIDVAMRRHRSLFLGTPTDLMGAAILANYFDPGYPNEGPMGGVGTDEKRIFGARISTLTPADAIDQGVSTWRDTNTITVEPRSIKSRFTAQNIEVYIAVDGEEPSTGDLAEIVNGVPKYKVDSDLVGAQVTITSGLMPSWRFGNLGFSTVVRGRRGITARLTFLNTNRGRRQFQEFLRPERNVQKVWIVFHDGSRNKRMIIKMNARISGTGQLPGDDGQNANTTELNYRSVGVNRVGDILGDGESDFELIFDDLSGIPSGGSVTPAPPITTTRATVKNNAPTTRDFSVGGTSNTLLASEYFDDAVSMTGVSSNMSAVTITNGAVDEEVQINHTGSAGDTSMVTLTALGSDGVGVDHIVTITLTA